MRIKQMSMIIFALSIMMGSPAFAAFTVTPSLPGGNSLTEGAQASVSVSVTNTGNSAESNIIVNLISSPSWFSVVTSCSVISSLQKDQSSSSSCIISPTGTGTGLGLTATASSSGGTEGSGQISGITVNPSSSALSAQISSDSSVSASSVFYVGVTVIASSSADSRNVITTISRTSGSCVIDPSYASASQNIGNITKGTSKSPTSWKVTAPSSSGSCAFSVSVTSDNAGSAAPSKTVAITGGGNNGGTTGGTTGSTGSTGGSSGAAAATDNKTSEKKAEKAEKEKNVPPGLVNNTKLQAAIEKVLAKGKLSQSAIDNLIRLSDLIKSDVFSDRSFKTENGKSAITEKIKYSGAKKIRNFMIHAKLPKEFAAKAGDINVSALAINVCPAGKECETSATQGTVETVESDPEFLITFAEALPNQEFIIAYTVNAVADKSVLGSASSQVYAESLEELPASEKPLIETVLRQNYVIPSIIAIVLILLVGTAIVKWKHVKSAFKKK